MKIIMVRHGHYRLEASNRCAKNFRFEQLLNFLSDGGLDTVLRYVPPRREEFTELHQICEFERISSLSTLPFPELPFTGQRKIHVSGPTFHLYTQPGELWKEEEERY